MKKIEMDQQKNKLNKPAIFQENNHRLNNALYFIIAGVMLAPFFIFPHLEVKSSKDQNKITLEQRLEVLPDVMTLLYQDALFIYQDKLPAYQYDQFTWIMSRKSFEVDILLSDLPLNELQQIFLSRYEQHGWTMLSNDLADPLTTGQTIRWTKNKWVAEVRYIDDEKPYWYITFHLMYK